MSVTAAPNQLPKAMSLDQVQLAIVQIWQKCFAVETIGPNDNFYDLGGSSVMASQIAAEIDSALGLNVPSVAILTSETIAGLIQTIASNK